MQIVVLQTRKLEELTRASALLRDASIPHERRRMVGGIEVEMTPDAADMVSVSWRLYVDQEYLEAAKGVLGPLIAETGARPPSAWMRRYYLVGLFALVALVSLRACG